MARQGEVLFSAYRAADYADPKGFAVQLASVLSEFSEDVVIHVTSPKTGIQRRSKWPPTISEVLEACEQHQDYLKRVRESRPVKPSRYLPPPPSLEQGSWANLFVPEGHDRYEKMVEWTKNEHPKFWMFGSSSDGRPGVWVTVDAFQGVARAKPERGRE